MKLRAFLLALAVLGLTIPAAEAQRDRDRGGIPGAQSWNPGGMREPSIRPLREILRAVEQQLPGQLVGAARLQEVGGGRAIYLLRWRTADGRLLDIAVDAESGAIVR